MRTIRRCELCNLFLKSAPDYVEYDQGVDEEWDCGDIIRTGWTSETQFRICKCGYENKEDV